MSRVSSANLKIGQIIFKQNVKILARLASCIAIPEYFFAKSIGMLWYDSVQYQEKLSAKNTLGYSSYHEYILSFRAKNIFLPIKLTLLQG